MFTRFLPVMGMFLFVAVGFVWRSWVQYRRYGNFGVAVFRGGDWRRQVRDIIFCLLLIAVVLQTLVFAAAPQALSRTLVVPLPPWAMWVGALLLLGGLALTVAAQLGMGVSWRVGIDDDARPGLVTGGLYQFCRNPIYLGMLTTLAGLSILLPTFVSIALCLGVVWCVRTQVLLEEEYLQQTYGDEFRAYASRIGRFVPGLGKLSSESA